jgi:hypothetical protein
VDSGFHAKEIPIFGVHHGDCISFAGGGKTAAEMQLSPTRAFTEVERRCRFLTQDGFTAMSKIPITRQELSSVKVLAAIREHLEMWAVKDSGNASGDPGRRNHLARQLALTVAPRRRRSRGHSSPLR